MHDAVRLLRLVRPHFIGFGAAARITVEGGEVTRVSPHEVDGAGAAAFIDPSPEVGEVGFRESDLAAFDQLWNQYNTADIPQRVEMAVQWYERACWERDGNIRIPLLVTSLECLVNTAPLGATSHFVVRVQAMVDRGVIPVDLWQGREIELAYGLRSALLHGRLNLQPQERAVALALLRKLDITARLLVRNAIEQRELRALFVSTETVDGGLPVDTTALEQWKANQGSLPVLSWMQRPKKR